MFFHLFTLSSIRVSGLVVVLSDSPCERIGKWEIYLSAFEIGHIIVGSRLAGACDKTATLLGVSRATVSKAYTNHEKTTSAKRNSGRNSALTEGDRCTLRKIVSKNHRTAAAQVIAEACTSSA
jgi:hypothetical protein